MVGASVVQCWCRLVQYIFFIYLSISISILYLSSIYFLSINLSLLFIGFTLLFGV